jgi:predicted nucleic acid-binding protein
MNRYLLDTNHLGEAIDAVSVVRDRLQQLHREGDVFRTCGPVLCELLVGVAVRKDKEKMRRRLDKLLELVRVWPIEIGIAERYAQTYHELKNAGRALSQVDIMLVAVARETGATLLTTDNDFRPISDIHLENWLAN